MKKSTLAIACCIGLMLFASCKKDVAPTITLFQGEGYITENAEIYTSTDVKVGFVATGENLTKIVVSATQNGAIIQDDIIQLIDNESSYTMTTSLSFDTPGIVTITGTVFDKKGNGATKSFDIYCDEKPNAKFIGHYEGTALLNGTFEAVIEGVEPMQQTIENQPFATSVEITEGADINTVVAAITINEQTDTVVGTVEGNKVAFEAINETITYNYEYQGFSVPVTFNMNYIIIGELNDNHLDLDGTCIGTGELHVFMYNGTINIDSTVGGSLVKTN